MSRKKLRRTKRQLMTLEQACGAIRETMPEAAEVVQQHAQSTQKALDLIGRIMSARNNMNGMTLEQACGAIRETMPEAAEVVQQHAQSTQKAINRAGQIISARDNVNGMTLKQARSTIQETMPEAAEVVLEHTQRVQKILGLVDGIMKYVRAISEAIKRRLALGRKTHSAKRQLMTLEQACGAIRETMPEAAEVVQQHAQSTQEALDLIGRITSARDNVNGMTLEQAYGAIRETMPEAAEVVQQHAQSTQKALDRAEQVMPVRDNVSGMTLKKARNTIQDTMPKAAEVVLEHTQRVQQAIDLIGQIMSAHDIVNGECARHFKEFERLLKDDYLEFARKALIQRKLKRTLKHLAENPLEYESDETVTSFSVPEYLYSGG